jgi:hypothetical protein
MTLSNLRAIVRNEMNEQAKEKWKGIKTKIKYKYAPNVNQVIGSVKDILITAYVTSSEKEALMERMKEETAHALVPVRPSRSNLRPDNPRKSKFHHNQKLIRRLLTPP